MFLSGLNTQPLLTVKQIGFLILLHHVCPSVWSMTYSFSFILHTQSLNHIVLHLNIYPAFSLASLVLSLSKLRSLYRIVQLSPEWFTWFLLKVFFFYFFFTNTILNIVFYFSLQIQANHVNYMILTHYINFHFLKGDCLTQGYAPIS